MFADEAMASGCRPDRQATVRGTRQRDSHHRDHRLLGVRALLSSQVSPGQPRAAHREGARAHARLNNLPREIIGCALKLSRYFLFSGYLRVVNCDFRRNVQFRTN